MKIVKFLLGFIALLIIGSISVAGYFGFVPILSQLMGADKPKDLGVVYSKKEYESFNNKVGNKIIETTENMEPAKSIEYSGKRDVNDNFSQEEISSRLNYGRWKYMPIGNVQTRINSDGTVEFSANVLMDRLPGFVAYEGMGKYTMADVTAGLDFIKMIKVNPPVYMKFNASITDNILQGSIQSLQVGKFNVPLEKLGINEVAHSVFKSIISKVPSFYAKSVTFSNGSMHYQGTIPESMKIEVVK